ncbi:MAG: hypothetical protein JWM49_2198 [Microbacteriaceae bacterium]|nr:hypothetical protein [Microbacteriaceae bacterium]
MPALAPERRTANGGMWVTEYGQGRLASQKEFERVEAANPHLVAAVFAARTVRLS